MLELNKDSPCFQTLPNHLEYFGGEGEDVEINPLIKWHIEKGKTLDL